MLARSLNTAIEVFVFLNLWCWHWGDWSFLPSWTCSLLDDQRYLLSTGWTWIHLIRTHSAVVSVSVRVLMRGQSRGPCTCYPRAFRRRALGLVGSLRPVLCTFHAASVMPYLLPTLYIIVCHTKSIGVWTSASSVYWIDWVEALIESGREWDRLKL